MEEILKAAVYDRAWKADQSWHREAVCAVPVNAGETMVRVSVVRNAYDFQSYAAAEAWTHTGGWQKLVWIHANTGDLTCIERRGKVAVVNYVSPELSEAAVKLMQQDTLFALTEATQILRHGRK